MRYYDLADAIERGKILELQTSLLSSNKNTTIRMLRDYYNGEQWIKNSWMTDTTRSGKTVWNIHKKNPNDMGVGEGDLQVYNVCDSTVNVYSSYARGTINDDNRIIVDDNEALQELANDKINLDVLIPRFVTRAGVDSVVIPKFREDGGLDLVDSLEIFPIYDGDDRIGTVRIYEISANDPMIVENNIDIKKGQKAIYMEIWRPEGGVMWLTKFINKTQIEDGKAPFEFDPHIYISNKDNEFVKFDENHIEVSDVARLVDIQDALNKTLTEEGIIISKVAFPMIKVIKEAYDMMAEGKLNADDLSKKLSEISLVAGKIISAPIEVVPGQEIPTGVDNYVDNIFEQVYRITGIPKGVYVSEGMSGISEKTMSAMMESLKRRIDEKRANIEKGIKEYVCMLANDFTLGDSVHIEWSEMFAMSKAEQADLLIRGNQAQVFPKDYALERLMDILGDGDKFEEVWAKIEGDDIEARLNIEREKLGADAQKEVKAKEEMLNKERELRVKKEIDNALLTRELDTLASGI
ncbi:MAG: hypothetical protein BWY21_01989 [Parcubacteria group bacterium ADurb.Bin216]|nr:MAG: hypothetical protein BWY21_01989 [Parcubacteria group bacterium ADurb.Bin216]